MLGGLLICCLAVHAEESPQNPPLTGFDKAAYLAGAQTNLTITIGRADCLAYALQANSEIKIRRIDPVLRADDLQQARAVFEPSLTAQANLRDATQKSDSIANSNISMTRLSDFSLGLGGKLPLGTRYNLEFLADKLKSNSDLQTINPSYTVQPIASLTQPLLRGAGLTVNRAEIIIAANNRQMAGKNFQETAMTIITRVLRAYYNLHYTRERYRIEADALDRTTKLLEINRQRHAKGLISSVDLLETETSVAERQKNLIAAESAVRNAEDELKFATNMVDDPQLWNARLELLEEPQADICRANIIESLERAFEFRPDYQAMKIALANRDIAIKVTRNALLPTLDLIGSFGLNGLDESFQDAWNDLETDRKEWMIGARLTVPWGGGDRARHHKSQWEKVQALLQMKRLEQTIVFEVRDRVRDVDIQFRQMEASRLSAAKETLHYNAQHERYTSGQISTHDMLDYQNRLATARLDFVKALIDYQVAIIRLDQAEGMTLAKNNISLEMENAPQHNR